MHCDVPCVRPSHMLIARANVVVGFLKHVPTTREYALVLEDDLQLSPLYFTWLKRALRKYRGSDEARGKYKNMCGITLQKAEVVAIRRWAKFNEAWNMKRHFGYQQPGSWGLSMAIFAPCGFLYFFVPCYIQRFTMGLPPPPRPTVLP